jgi:hypothetical protein
MSDVQATTQATGVADIGSEGHFESLYEAGAFEPEKRTETAPEGVAPEVNQGQDQDTRTGPKIGDKADETAAVTQDDPKVAAGQQAAEETPSYQSLDEMLTALKVDPLSVRALPVTVKIDGVEKAVPLEDVIKSFQLEGHVNNKSIELSNLKTQFEQERQAVRQLAQQQVQQNQAMGNMAMQMLNHDFQKVDWNALRQQNPAEYAALHAEFGQRQNQIQNLLQTVQNQTAQEAQLQQQAQAQSQSQQLIAESERLMGARPEWRDQAAFAKDKEMIAQYARTTGFKDAELNQIFDHRYMLILHDAARYQALQAASPQVLKQVRQAPPMAKPGSRSNTNPDEARRNSAIERFNRNPRDQDAQAAMFDVLGG